MSDYPYQIPTLLVEGLCDRLKRSLRYARMSQKDMENYLEYHRNSVGNWVTGKSNPSSLVLRVWAERTGVPVEWLRTGLWPGSVAPRGPVLHLVGATEAAAILECTVVTVHRLKKRGQLTPIGRLGTSRLSPFIFDKAEVTRLAKRRAQKPANG